MKRRFLILALIAIMLLGCTVFAACDNGKTDSITVAQPTCAVETLYYGDDLPSISTTTTGGKIELDKNQTLTVGTKDYTWTFTPDDASLNYTNLTGTISLTVQKAIVTVAQPTYDGILTYGDDLPAITTTTTGGSIALDKGQTLKAGEFEDYTWTFTPIDTDNYQYTPLIGTMKLIVGKATVAVVQPIYEGETLYYGDALPVITTTTAGGSVVLDENQSLRVGTSDYTWTFIPTDTDNHSYSPLTGTVELTVEKAIVTIAQPTYIGETLYYNGELPSIITATEGGSIELDEGQMLIVGTNDYTWTFTPDDTDNYEYTSLTGIISLTVQKAIITVVQPTYNGTLTYGDELPVITTTTVGGSIALNEGQTLIGGTNDYMWTFTPTANTENYEYKPLTGTISLTVEKANQSIPQGTELEISERLATKITLVALGDTYEYSNDTSSIDKVWQQSNIFESLTQATKYTFYARLKGNDNYNPSAHIEIIAFTEQGEAITIAQPTYSGTLRYGQNLPTISTSTLYGTIALVEGQTLIVGTNDYNWVFTPDSDNNFEYVSLTGTISLTVEKGLQSIPSNAALYVDGVFTTATSVILYITNGGSSNNYEYRVLLFNSGLVVFDWQNFPSNGRVEGLDPNTTYFFEARLKGNDNYEPSLSSIYVDAKTKSESSPYFEFEGGTLTGYTSLAEQQKLLTIPSSYNGEIITTIGEGALSWLMILKEVVIPNTITSIRDGAFEWCFLSKIYFLGTAQEWALIDIADYAFDGDIEDILYFFSEDEPEEAGNYWHYVGTTPTVYGSGEEPVAEALTPSPDFYFDFSDYEDGIIAGAEDGDESYVVIPSEYEGVEITIIGGYGFSWLMSIETIVIPNSITVIQSLTFNGCYGLSEIFYYGTSIEWALIDIDDDAFDDSIDDILYFYSETEPEESDIGNYWHIVDGIAVAW